MPSSSPDTLVPSVAAAETLDAQLSDMFDTLAARPVPAPMADLADQLEVLHPPARRLAKA